MVVGLDFSKALVSIRWEALEKIGVGPTFLYLIKMLFTGVGSCVTNAGMSSGIFRPQGGIS